MHEIAEKIENCYSINGVIDLDKNEILKLGIKDDIYITINEDKTYFIVNKKKTLYIAVIGKEQQKKIMIIDNNIKGQQTSHNRSVCASGPKGPSLRSFPRLTPAHFGGTKPYGFLYGAAQTSYTAGTLCDMEQKNNQKNQLILTLVKNIVIFFKRML
jgi:hypothetical protein